MGNNNKYEAINAVQIAEKKLLERDLIGAKTYALNAQMMYPSLENLSQVLTTIEVFLAAENKINGEMDLYGILGVDPTADKLSIVNRTCELISVLFVDKTQHLIANAAFKIVYKAGNILSDDGKRLQYDQRRINTSNYDKGSSSMSDHVVETDTAGSALSSPKGEKFWTVCYYCKTDYEYLREHVDSIMLCLNCKMCFWSSETVLPPSIVSQPDHSNQPPQSK